MSAIPQNLSFNLLYLLIERLACFTFPPLTTNLTLNECGVNKSQDLKKH